MRSNMTGRAAWIVAAALWASAALFPPTHAVAQEAAQAAEQPAAVGSAIGVTATESAPPTRLHPKKSAGKSRKAERHAKAKKPAQQETAKEETAQTADLKPTQDDAMSPAVANANAQWPSDAKPADSYNMSAQAGNVLSQMDAQPAPAAAADDSAKTEQVVAADQLNELDRAAEEKPPLTLAKATIDAPATPAATVENSQPWEQTSMVGKVFIALGGLLTVASAARMFMA